MLTFGPYAQYAAFVFFLWYGLRAFVPALNSDMFRKVGAGVALLVALLVLLGM